jgi:DNA polymerase I-like protein with 3'-5' exonuclease and polymerase domains
MQILVFDVETTHREKEGGGFTPLPYFGNQLVSIGYKAIDTTIGEDTDGYLCFYHKAKEPTKDAFKIFQSQLDQAEVIVGHNLKFDLNWIISCNFNYYGNAYDTMVAEYVLARARKWPLSLDAVSKRYEVAEKKKDLTQEYLAEGKTFAEIPWDIVEEYGRADVQATWEVAEKQVKEKYGTTWERMYGI